MIYNNPSFQKPKSKVNYVNYIESTEGTGQYFNTGLDLSGGWLIEAKLRFLPVSQSYMLKTQGLWGTQDEQAPYNRNYFTFSAPTFGASYGVGAYDHLAYDMQAVFNADLEIRTNNSGYPRLSINGSADTAPRGTVSATGRSARPFYLFKLNYDSNPCPAYMRAYYFKIYDLAETLLADYRPALDESGVACLYDEVSKSYLLPAYGTFAYG